MEIIPPQIVSMMPFSMVFLFMFALSFTLLRKTKLFKDNKNASVLVSLVIAWFIASSTFVIDFMEVLTVKLGIFLISGALLILVIFSSMPKLKGFGAWILIPVFLIMLAIVFTSLGEVSGIPQTAITLQDGGVNVAGVHLSPENITLLIIAVLVIIFIAWAWSGGESGGREFKIKLFD